RGSETDEVHVRVREGGIVGGEREATGINPGLQDLVEAGFEERGLSGRELVDLCLVDVNADHGVSERGHRGRVYCTEVTATDHTQLHGWVLLVFDTRHPARGAASILPCTWFTYPGADMSDTSRHPTYSVVIPTYNVRPWLRQTLDSVLRQREDLEVIVVDDASTDGTDDLAREYAARDPRIRVVANEGSGGGSARNLGARSARGEYLIFADGDDLIPDGAYAALVGSLERSGSDMAVGDYLKFRAVDTWRPTVAMPAFGRPAAGVTLEDEPSLLFSRPCWNRAFRASFWRRAAIEFPDVPRSNDIVPMVRALTSAQTIDIVEDIVYVYRERPGSGSMTARAGASTSLVSYLTQESECARIVA